VRRRRKISGRKISGRKNQQGVIITLVAVFMLFVIGAMAALSIDVVTLYTARSEAQLAADAAALAGARVLANSGLTSTAAGPAAAEDLARTVAKQAAANNLVGGRNLVAGTAQCTTGQEICVSFNDGSSSFATDPHVTVTVQRTDLPTFFARIWGRMQVAVGASATAEAYNPSGATALGGATPPVALHCVKPWLLPNLDPSGGTSIFGPDGSITTTTLLGWTSNSLATRLGVACTLGNCTTAPLPPAPWQYYPGDSTTSGLTPPLTSFAPPPSALPACAAGFTPYQEDIAGCFQTPIACGSNPQSNYSVNLDMSDYANRGLDTANAVNCLTHSNTNEGDTINPAAIAGGQISPPFEFIAGGSNPIPGLPTNDEMVSDSLVTVPVFNSSTTVPTSPVQIIGFVQLFLNPEGFRAPLAGGNAGTVKTTVINIAGCATTGWNATPILGNGASPVAVRLISPP
jgi:Flp pilus assembly protein TadG